MNHDNMEVEEELFVTNYQYAWELLGLLKNHGPALVSSFRLEDSFCSYEGELPYEELKLPCFEGGNENSSAAAASGKLHAMVLTGIRFCL